MSIVLGNRVCDTDAEAVTAIRSMVHGLLPNWQNPEAFFVQRSEVSGGLTKLLRHLDRQPRVLGRPREDVERLTLVAGTGSRYAASRSESVLLAARVFQPSPAASETRETGGNVVSFPTNHPNGRKPRYLRRPRLRYPLPPRALAVVAILC